MIFANNVTLLSIGTALLFLALGGAVAAPDFDEDYYNECTLKNVKPGMDISAIQLIAQACEHKATPKKCRGLSKIDPFGPNERQTCVNACKTESFYSRTFGVCSKG